MNSRATGWLVASVALIAVSKIGSWIEQSQKAKFLASPEGKHSVAFIDPYPSQFWGLLLLVGLVSFGVFITVLLREFLAGSRNE